MGEEESSTRLLCTVAEQGPSAFIRSLPSPALQFDLNHCSHCTGDETEMTHIAQSLPHPPLTWLCTPCSGTVLALSVSEVCSTSATKMAVREIMLGPQACKT